MKTFMVTLLLMLFEVNLNYAHRLSKLESQNDREMYEVKEDQSALVITHPKDEATKLREVIYFHIIERPYDAKDLSHDKIEPDFENRHFTNSHSGIQFEKKDCNDDEDESTSVELVDDLSNSLEETDDNINTSEEKDNEQLLDKNDLPKDEINDKDKSSSNGNIDSIKTDERNTDDDKSPIDDDSIQIDIRFSDFIDNTTEGDAKVVNRTTVKTVNRETKNEAITESPQIRRKREITHPITGNEKSTMPREGLNYAADDISLKREEGTYGMSLTGNRGVVWNDVKPTHIEYHVGELEAITTPRPDVDLTEDISTTESVIEEVEAVIQIDEDTQANDEGDEVEEEVFIEPFAEMKKIFDNLVNTMDKTNKSESQQENKKDGDSELLRDGNKHEDSNNRDEDDSDLDPIEVEKSFIEILEVFKELAGNINSQSVVTDVNNTTRPADDVDISEEKVFGAPSNGNFLRKLKDDDDVTNDKQVKPSTERNHKDKETSNKDDDKKQQQFVKDILKNKYFWAWLKDSSVAYLEVLMKKFGEKIKTEVGKQIEQYFEEHKIDNCKQDKEDQNNDVLSVPTSNVTDDNVNVNTTDKPSITNHNDLASNDTTSESINKLNETSPEISNKKHKPSNDKNANLPVKIEAQNLFGSSIGSGKVTNIFIYNINKLSDLENIEPVKNDTNGIFIFGLDDKKPDQENDNSDKDTIAEVETVKPDVDSEHNQTVINVIETDVNTSTIEPEAEDQQNNEKDKIEDKEQVKDEDNAKPVVEQDHLSIEEDKIEDKDQVEGEDNVELLDKSEITSNDQTNTEAKNEDEKSIEMNKEESAASTEKPLEVLKDENEKDTTTEKEKVEKHPDDIEIDKSNIE